MTENNAITQCLELLDAVQDNCKLFESLVLTTEVIAQLPLEEAQIALMNAYLEKAQKEWSDSFIQLLEVVLKWLKQNNGEDD